MPQGNCVKQKEDLKNIYCGKNPTEITSFLYILSSLLLKIALSCLLNKANLGHQL